VCVSATEGVMSIAAHRNGEHLRSSLSFSGTLRLSVLASVSACAAFFACGLRRPRAAGWKYGTIDTAGPERPKARASVAQAAGDDSTRRRSA